MRFSGDQDYGGVVAQPVSEDRATVHYDDCTIEIVTFPDPEVSVLRVGPGGGGLWHGRSPPRWSRVCVQQTYPRTRHWMGTVEAQLDDFGRVRVRYDDGLVEDMRLPHPDVVFTAFGRDHVMQPLNSPVQAPPAPPPPEAPARGAPAPPLRLHQKHPEAASAPRHAVPIRIGPNFQIDPAILAEPPVPRPYAAAGAFAWPRALAPSCDLPERRPAREVRDDELGAERTAWALEPLGPTAQPGGAPRQLIYLRSGPNTIGRRKNLGLTDPVLSRDQCDVHIDARNQVWVERHDWLPDGEVLVNGLPLGPGKPCRTYLEVDDELWLKSETNSAYRLVLVDGPRGPSGDPGDRACAARAAHAAESARAERLAERRLAVAERVWAPPTTPAARRELRALLDVVEPGAEEVALREAFSGGFPWARALAGRRRGAAGIAERWADVGPYAVAAAILRHRRRYALVAKEFHVTAGDVQTYLYSFLKPEFPDLFDELKWALHQRRTRVRRRDGPSNVKVGTLEPVPYEEDGNQPFCYICRLSGELMCCDSCERSVHLHCLNLARPPDGDWFCSDRCTARGPRSVAARLASKRAAEKRG